MATLISAVKDKFDSSNAIWRLVGICALLVGAWLIIHITTRLVRQAFRRVAAGVDEQRARRLEVLSNLTVRAIRWCVYIIVADIILSILGIIQGTVSIAGLGIASVALGIAAQPLVKDAVGGFFIILEGQYGVGDYVTIAGITGIVEDVGLRRTLLRGLNGELYTVPHSLVDKTVNLSRGSFGATVDVRVNYRDDLERVLQVLGDTCRGLEQELADALEEPPKVLGVTDLGEHYITVRLVARTRPLKQWQVERELRRAVRRAFAREGFLPPRDDSQGD